ncbi:MAG: Alpha/Beta hydrolase protein [Piptocephalis tieghemiana]|nr:MAG: Alpha/Beta hydrolase protein [Piptocephalis tieghemiana]
MSESSIWIPGCGGVQLAATLYMPKGFPSLPTCQRPNNTKLPIALILHGALGHKDYLYQKPLARSLPIPSIRFDFGGNGDSGERYLRPTLTEDIIDLESVATWCRNTGFKVDGVIGHSKGAAIAIHWSIETRPKDLKWIVDLSGRYYLGPEVSAITHPTILQSIKHKGYHDTDHVARGRKVTYRLTQEDVDTFNDNPRSMDDLLDRFPYDLLLIHGSEDRVVSVKDSQRYHEVLPESTLKIFDGADHNFTGMKNEVVKAILEWLDLKSLLPAPQANL